MKQSGCMKGDGGDLVQHTVEKSWHEEIMFSEEKKIKGDFK
jgi:hypothetical protein